MRIYINIKTELDLLLLDFRLIIEAFLFNIKLIRKIDNCKSESEDIFNYIITIKQYAHIYHVRNELYIVEFGCMKFI